MDERIKSMTKLETPTKVIRVLKSEVYQVLSQDLSKTLEQKVKVTDMTSCWDNNAEKPCWDISYEQVNP